MTPMQKSIAYGIGFTAVMSAAAVGLFGLSEHLSMPIFAQVAFALASLAVIALLPGSPFGLLALNMHSTEYAVLTLLGDVVFYSYVAHRVLTRKTRRPDREKDVKG